MPKTLAQKLFLKPNYRIFIQNQPDSFIAKQLIELPENIVFIQSLEESPDVIIQFSTNAEHLNSITPSLKAAMKESTYLWICYPKGGKKAAIETDLNRDSIWAALKSAGFKAVHIITIDEIWSAVRFRRID